MFYSGKIEIMQNYARTNIHLTQHLRVGRVGKLPVRHEQTNIVGSNRRGQKEPHSWFEQTEAILTFIREMLSK